MAIDFACTSPIEWARKALDDRAQTILTPGDYGWRVKTTPWARVVSSANIDGDSSYRKEYALWSKNTSDFASGYREREIGGIDKVFKPTYGLESIKVSYKGTMGSTKSCTVDFKVWTIEDLQIMEQLYMVPGISVIVEWGWSLDPYNNEVRPYDNFLTYSAKENPYSDIMDTIIKRRHVYYGCYDGLVGVITNFNYALNEQLGFDCSFELCAPGELWLEQSTSTVSRQCVDTATSTPRKMSNLEKEFHKYYTRYKSKEKLDALYQTHKANYPSLSNPIVVYQQWETETRQYDKDHRTGIVANAIGFLRDTAGAIEVPEIFISWNFLIKILNENINQYLLENNAPTDNSKQNPTISLAMDLIPVTLLPKICTLDPRVCTFSARGLDPAAGLRRAELINGFIKQTFDVNEEDFFERRLYPSGKNLGFVVDAKDEILALGTTIDVKRVNEVYDEVVKDITDSEGYVGLLNNIYVNAGFLRDISVVSSGDNVTADDYLKKILDAINASSGNLWNLQFRSDEKDPHLLHIYDANHTSISSRKNELKPYEFKILNQPNTLIRSMNLESKLVDGFKSMVLYGNSNDNGSVDTTHQAMSLYSNKITDGFKIEQDIKNESSLYGNDNSCTNKDGEIVESEVPQDPEADLDMAFGNLLDAVTDESVSSIKSAMQGYVSYINTKKPKIASKLIMNQNILLPFNFSVQIDGFSGFNWGNTIKVDYLPSRYFNAEGGSRIYFQITKINHEITNADWITGVETIMRVTPEFKTVETDYSTTQFKFTPDENTSVEIANEKSNVATSTSTLGYKQQLDLKTLRAGLATQNEDGTIIPTAVNSITVDPAVANNPILGQKPTAPGKPSTNTTPKPASKPAAVTPRQSLLLPPPPGGATFTFTRDN